MKEQIKHRSESEHIPQHHEGHHDRIAKHHESRAEKSRHEHQENIDTILKKIEKSGKSGQEITDSRKTEEPKANQHNPRFVGTQLKETNLRRSLRRIQKDLKPYQRPFSKFIHNGVVEQASEVTASTIARPEGLLFGGVACFITSLGVLIICRYYGYEYNFFIGLISFPIGFMIGLLGKFILRPLRRR